MDAFLDTLWLKILAVIEFGFNLATGLLAHLNFMGPALLIFLIVVVLVAVTKIITRRYTTRRYQRLKENYEHWFEVRRQAMSSEDPEKGKALAKNIDQAELNKAYYDFFFEGFLKNIITTVLPILLTAAFVVKAYGPANLEKTFGKPYVLEIARSGGEPVAVLVRGRLRWPVSATTQRLPTGSARRPGPCRARRGRPARWKKGSGSARRSALTGARSPIWPSGRLPVHI